MSDELEQAYDLFRRDPKKGRNAFLRAAKPFIQARAGIYREAPVPQPAVIGNGQILALRALDVYKPHKSGVRTHLENHLRGMSRFVNQHKNVARIPEHRTLKIGAFKAAHQRMLIELGRHPSPQELADELSWPLKDIRQMEAALHASVAESESYGGESNRAHNDRFYENLSFARFKLSPADQQVVDFLYGINGQPQLSVNATAARTGISASKVYQIRQQMARNV